MKKRTLNKYEREVMFNTYLIKACVVVALILNLILPVYSKTIGFKSILQWFVLGTYIYGLLNALGYCRGQKIPSLPLGAFRILQIVSHMVLNSNPIAWQFFGILLALDVLFIYLLFMDKSSYCYLYVGEDEE